MRLKAVSIKDVLLIDSKLYYDDRGFFFESFNQLDFEKVTGFSPFFTQAYLLFHHVRMFSTKPQNHKLLYSQV
ncbi:dTDP-4-dehydrorhamnose 3,5-epimerase family protein [Candidatus Pseudothioglobus singularis]|nr:dTDP-4-dehydrorhamnose 3,5-epimerase family protein [Candidatus Pseudothioglobus singularis]